MKNKEFYHPSITELFHEVKSENPELGQRLNKAVGMVVRGMINRTGENSFDVASQSRPVDYVVQFNTTDQPQPGWHCNCPDAGSKGHAPVIDWCGSVGQKTCKHIVAVGLEWMRCGK